MAIKFTKFISNSVIIIINGLLLTGCGQTGPLFLPSKGVPSSQKNAAYLLSPAPSKSSAGSTQANTTQTTAQAADSQSASTTTTNKAD